MASPGHFPVGRPSIRQSHWATIVPASPSEELPVGAWTAIAADRLYGFKEQARTMSMSKKQLYYSADITKGALMLAESRALARVLMDAPELSPSDWEERVVRDNVLQKRSPVTARSRARYLRARLTAGPADLLPLIVDGDPELAAQAAMALAIKHSRLLGDYMDHVLRVQRIRREPALQAKDWMGFLENAESYAPEVENWSESTRKKLGQVVHLTLSEAGYLENTRAKTIQPVQVRHELRAALLEAEEDQVLRCLEVCAT